MKLKSNSLLIFLGTLGLIYLSSQRVITAEAQTIKATLVSQSTTSQLLTQTDTPAPTTPAQPTPAPTTPAQPIPTPTTPVQPSSPDIKLKQALDQKNFKAADQATYELMLEAAGPKSKAQGRFDQGEWEQFPCSDLKEIDRLWREGTQGSQGFSVQKEVLDSLKSTPLAFQIQVGWRDKAGKWLVTPKYSAIKKAVDYDKVPNFKNPPRGHLPAKLAWWDARDHRFEKIYACKL